MQECRHESEICNYQQIQLSNNKIDSLMKSWGVCLTWLNCKFNPVFSRGKDIESWAEKVKIPRVVSEQTVSKPSVGNWVLTWLVLDNRNKGPTRFYYFDLPDRAISTKKWNNCGNKRGNLYLTFLHGCSLVSSWLWENNRLTYTHPNLLFYWSL